MCRLGNNVITLKGCRENVVLTSCTASGKALEKKAYEIFFIFYFFNKVYVIFFSALPLDVLVWLHFWKFSADKNGSSRNRHITLKRCCMYVVVRCNGVKTLNWRRNNVVLTLCAVLNRNCLLFTESVFVPKTKNSIHDTSTEGMVSRADPHLITPFPNFLVENVTIVVCLTKKQKKEFYNFNYFFQLPCRAYTVSYTHLTLPTICSV